jgi:hypothetical protein
MVSRLLPRLIAKILAAEPAEAVRVVFEPEDVERLYTFNGHALPEYTDAVMLDDRPGQGPYVRSLAEGMAAIPDHLVCVTAQHADPTVLPDRIAIYDGWHRASAWQVRLRAGRRDGVSAYLIVTKHEISW